MEFLTKLVETKESIKLKSHPNMHNPEMTYEDYGIRTFKHIPVSDRVLLSIQASSAHYCSPRKTIELSDYERMEFALLMGREFVSSDSVTDNQELNEKLEEYFEGSVYCYVPVELIETLYKELK